MISGNSKCRPNAGTGGADDDDDDERGQHDDQNGLGFTTVGIYGQKVRNMRGICEGKVIFPSDIPLISRNR